LSLLLTLSLTVAPALASDGQKPLKVKENPQLIGKRDINKGQLNFYSLEKIGMQNWLMTRSCLNTSTALRRTLSSIPTSKFR
jgi:hypothetical protein